MKLLAAEAPEGPAGYACPMHPEVTDQVASRCPACGMKMVPAALVPRATAGQGPLGEAQYPPGPYRHDGESAQGIEWEDDMVEVNKITTPLNMRWKLVDRSTGDEN